MIPTQTELRYLRRLWSDAIYFSPDHPGVTLTREILHAHETGTGTDRPTLECALRTFELYQVAYALLQQAIEAGKDKLR